MATRCCLRIFAPTVRRQITRAFNEPAFDGGFVRAIPQTQHLVMTSEYADDIPAPVPIRHPI